MSPIILAKVAAPSVTHPGRETLREPTDDEWPAINAYVERFVRDEGCPPFLAHEIAGVGEVYFMHPRRVDPTPG